MCVLSPYYCISRCIVGGIYIEIIFAVLMVVVVLVLHNVVVVQVIVIASAEVQNVLLTMISNVAINPFLVVVDCI